MLARMIRDRTMNDVVKSKSQPRKAHIIKASLKSKSASRIRGLHQRAIHRVWEQHDHALKLYQTSAYERVKIVKAGLPAKYVKTLTVSMHMPIEKFYRTTGLARPTIDRKIRSSKLLSQDESERVMGIARLVGQAQSLVEQSGGAAEFDAGRWVGDWLQKPLPALDGETPGELMDTVDGRALVSDLLAQQQSGAYG
jgi:putative toxin-antitoxin system antitoxin component (TIGR02293 family)